MLRRFLVAICLAVAVAPLPACVHTAPTVLASVADTVTRLEQTTDAIVLSAKTNSTVVNPLTGKPLVSSDQLVAVALVGDKVGRLGTDLASALRELSAAKAAGKDTVVLQAQVRLLLNTASTALSDVGKSIQPGLLKEIDSGVVTAFSLIAQIQAAAGL